MWGQPMLLCILTYYVMLATNFGVRRTYHMYGCIQNSCRNVIPTVSPPYTGVNTVEV